VGEAPGTALGLYSGVLYDRSQVTLGQLTVLDGTANTLMFGEMLGGQGVGVRDFVRSWIGCGYQCTWFGLGRGNLPGNVGVDGTPQTFVVVGASYYNFSSRHAAGVQFAFGDCHTVTVRFGSTVITNAQLSQTFNGPGTIPAALIATDWGILQQLAGRKDGLRADESALLE